MKRIGPRGIVLLAAATLGVLAAPSTARALEVTASFTTSPAGVHICRTRQGSMECFERSPARLSVVFPDERSGKKYYLKKPGYRTREVLLTSSQSTVSVVMDRADIYFDPGKHGDAGLREIQRKTNQALEDLFYGEEPFADPSYSITGPGKVLLEGGKPVLVMGVTVDNYPLVRKIKSLRRKRKRSEREEAVLSLLTWKVAGPLLVRLRAHLLPLDLIDGVMLSVHFPSVEHSLETITTQLDQSSTTVTGTRLNTVSYGNVVQTQMAHSYRTVHFTTPYEETVVGSRKVLRTAVFSAPLEALPAKFSHPQGTRFIMDRTNILLNDNRQGTFDLFQN